MRVLGNTTNQQLHQLQCAFSIDSKCQNAAVQSEFSGFVDVMHRVNEAVTSRLLAYRTPLDLFDWYFFRQPYGKQYLADAAEARACAHALVGARRAAIAAGTEVPPDFLTSLLQLEEDGVFVDEEVVDQAMTFMAAGMETTASALMFAVGYLAKHPDAQGKARAEVLEVLGTRRPVHAGLKNLRYVEAVVKETMRLAPPAAGVARVLDHDIVLNVRVWGLALDLPETALECSRQSVYFLIKSSNQYIYVCRTSTSPRAPPSTARAAAVWQCSLAHPWYTYAPLSPSR